MVFKNERQIKANVPDDYGLTNGRFAKHICIRRVVDLPDQMIDPLGENSDNKFCDFGCWMNQAGACAGGCWQ